MICFMCLAFACIYTCDHMCAWYLQTPTEGVWVPETDLQMVVIYYHVQPELLTSEPSLQHLYVAFFFFFFKKTSLCLTLAEQFTYVSKQFYQLSNRGCYSQTASYSFCGFPSEGWHCPMVQGRSALQTPAFLASSLGGCSSVLACRDCGFSVSWFLWFI